jgi:hypothetical protein
LNKRAALAEYPHHTPGWSPSFLTHRTRFRSQSPNQGRQRAQPGSVACGFDETAREWKENEKPKPSRPVLPCTTHSNLILMRSEPDRATLSLPTETPLPPATVPIDSKAFHIILTPCNW